MSTFNHKNWYQRNWYWVMPVGFLMPVILVVGCGLMLITMSVVSKRFSDVHTMAIQEVQAHPDVITRLGEPVKSGWNINGNITRRDDVGDADLEIPVTGPNGEAVIHVKARQYDDEWMLQEVTVIVAGDEEPIIVREAETLVHTE